MEYEGEGRTIAEGGRQEQRERGTIKYLRLR